MLSLTPMSVHLCVCVGGGVRVGREQINSAIIELFEHIRIKNVKELIKYMVDKYRDIYEKLDYVDTYKMLVVKYDQNEQYEKVSASPRARTCLHASARLLTRALACAHARPVFSPLSLPPSRSRSVSAPLPLSPLNVRRSSVHTRAPAHARRIRQTGRHQAARPAALEMGRGEPVGGAGGGGAGAWGLSALVWRRMMTTTTSIRTMMRRLGRRPPRLLSLPRCLTPRRMRRKRPWAWLLLVCVCVCVCVCVRARAHLHARAHAPTACPHAHTPTDTRALACM